MPKTRKQNTEKKTLKKTRVGMSVLPKPSYLVFSSFPLFIQLFLPLALEAYFPEPENFSIWIGRVVTLPSLSFCYAARRGQRVKL